MKHNTKCLLTAVLAVLLAVPASAAPIPTETPPQIAATITQTTDAMRWAMDSGLIPQTTAVSDNATHALVAEALYRLSGSPRMAGLHFSDVRIGSDGWDAARWTVDNDVFFQYDDGAFAPDNTLTRTELAKVMRRYARAAGYATEVDTYRTSVSWAVDVGVLATDADGGVRTDVAATRADLAQALYRFCAYYNK